MLQVESMASHAHGFPPCCWMGAQIQNGLCEGMCILCGYGQASSGFADNASALTIDGCDNRPPTCHIGLNFTWHGEFKNLFCTQGDQQRRGLLREFGHLFDWASPREMNINQSLSRDSVPQPSPLAAISHQFKAFIGIRAINLFLAINADHNQRWPH